MTNSTYKVQSTFPSGYGAEHIGIDGRINKFGISFLFETKPEAEEALNIAKKDYQKRGLKRILVIVEHKTLKVQQ